MKIAAALDHEVVMKWLFELPFYKLAFALLVFIAIYAWFFYS